MRIVHCRWFARSANRTNRTKVRILFGYENGHIRCYFCATDLDEHMSTLFMRLTITKREKVMTCQADFILIPDILEAVFSSKVICCT